MKKIIISIILFIALFVPCFAEHETWFSIGPAFGNYFFSGFFNGTDYEQNYLGSPGVNLSFYAGFERRNLGIFFNWGILFPATGSIEEGFAAKDQVDFLLAGVFSTFFISSNVKLYYGAGPCINFVVFEHDEKEIISGEENIKKGSYLLGIGLSADAGFKFYLNGRFDINTGVTLSRSYAAHRDMRYFDENHTRQDIHAWVKGYSMISIKPYVCIGVHFP